MRPFATLGYESVGIFFQWFQLKMIIEFRSEWPRMFVTPELFALAPFCNFMFVTLNQHVKVLDSTLQNRATFYTLHSKRLWAVVLSSCELYKLLVINVCTVILLLFLFFFPFSPPPSNMYVLLFHQFSLNWDFFKHRPLRRIFCFG